MNFLSDFHIWILVCSQKDSLKLLKICSSYAVYSQIWLNLLKDDYHFFFYIFLRMDDRQFGYKQNFLLKKKYCFTSVIIQGSKAKVEVGARESVHMHRKMSAQPQKLSDS